MGNKTIYFRDDDLWSKAKTLAGKEGLSAVIQKAVEEFVQAAERQKEGWHRVILALLLRDEEEDPYTFVPTERIAFEGQSLARVDWPGITFSGQGYTECFRTRGGKLILTMDESDHDEDGITYYHVYDSLTELRGDPELKRLGAATRGRFLAEVSKQLGEDWAIWID